METIIMRKHKNEPTKIEPFSSIAFVLLFKHETFWWKLTQRKVLSQKLLKFLINCKGIKSQNKRLVINHVLLSQKTSFHWFPFKFQVLFTKPQMRCAYFCIPLKFKLSMEDELMENIKKKNVLHTKWKMKSKTK